MDYQTVKALEELHLTLLNARLRKRKTLGIKPEDFERYENAVKAAIPPFDFTGSEAERQGVQVTTTIGE